MNPTLLLSWALQGVLSSFEFQKLFSMYIALEEARGKKILNQFQSMTWKTIRKFIRNYVGTIMVNEITHLGMVSNFLGVYVIEMNENHPMHKSKEQMLVTFVHEVLHIPLCEAKIPHWLHDEKLITDTARSLVKRYGDQIAIFFSSNCKGLNNRRRWRTK